MFLIIAGVLVVIWVVGFGLFRAIVGGAIHFLLVLAVIALIWHLVSSRSRATPPTSTASIAASIAAAAA